MTTPLTIYRLGLCGNSANESTRKHHFRTQKHQKVNKSSQKTTPNRFGYWRPWVRVPPLRPKKEQIALAVICSFLSNRFGLEPSLVLRSSVGSHSPRRARRARSHAASVRIFTSGENPADIFPWLLRRLSFIRLQK